MVAVEIRIPNHCYRERKILLDRLQLDRITRPIEVDFTVRTAYGLHRFVGISEPRFYDADTVTSSVNSERGFIYDLIRPKEPPVEGYEEYMMGVEATKGPAVEDFEDDMMGVEVTNAVLCSPSPPPTSTPPPQASSPPLQPPNQVLTPSPSPASQVFTPPPSAPIQVRPAALLSPPPTPLQVSPPTAASSVPMAPSSAQVAPSQPTVQAQTAPMTPTTPSSSVIVTKSKPSLQSTPIAQKLRAPQIGAPLPTPAVSVRPKSALVTPMNGVAESTTSDAKPKKKKLFDAARHAEIASSTMPAELRKLEQDKMLGGFDGFELTKSAETTEREEREKADLKALVARLFPSEESDEPGKAASSALPSVEKGRDAVPSLVSPKNSASVAPVAKVARAAARKESTSTALRDRKRTKETVSKTTAARAIGPVRTSKSTAPPDRKRTSITAPKRPTTRKIDRSRAGGLKGIILQEKMMAELTGMDLSAPSTQPQTARAATVEQDFIGLGDYSDFEPAESEEEASSNQ